MHCNFTKAVRESIIFNGEYYKILEETLNLNLKTDSNRRRAEGGNCTTRSLGCFSFQIEIFKISIFDIYLLPTHPHFR